MAIVQIQASATGSGVVTIAAPETNNSPIITLPAENTTVVGTDVPQVLTNKTLGPGLMMGASVIYSYPEVATTSGTTVVLASTIPAWATIITVALNAVSTSGTAGILIQFGQYPPSSAWATNGYTSVTDNYSGTPGPVGTSTNGFRIGSAIAAASTTTVLCTFMRLGTNTGATYTYVGQWNGTNDTGNSMVFGTGTTNIATAVEGVRLTTIGGTDTFDAGSASVFYQ